MRTAVLASLVVGIVLTLVNHGQDLVRGHLDTMGATQIALTFTVPFLVSLVAGVLATCRERRATRDPC